MEEWRKEMINNDMDTILSFLQRQLDILEKDDTEYSIETGIPIEHADTGRAGRAISAIDTAIRKIGIIKDEFNRFLQEE